MISNRHDKAKAFSCPFCREPAPDKEEFDQKMMKRVQANDPATLCQMGIICKKDGDHDGAFEYWTKAAELGDVEAHCRLGYMYMNEEGVEKDEEMKVYHLEKAAIGGHPIARHVLALTEEKNGNMERAVKHYIIAAKVGYELSMKTLWKHYSLGNITKEDLDATLRSHQTAIDEMKSEQRDAKSIGALVSTMLVD